MWLYLYERSNLRLSKIVGLLMLPLLVATSCAHHKYDSIRDAKDWQNPFLVIEGDGVEVELPDDRAKVTTDKLQDYLSNLPDRYWPYGEIVAAQEASIRSGNDDELIRHNKALTKQIVESMGIRIKWWNSTASVDHERRQAPIASTVIRRVR
jgi:hypothetical protein